MMELNIGIYIYVHIYIYMSHTTVKNLKNSKNIFFQSVVLINDLIICEKNDVKCYTLIIFEIGNKCFSIKYSPCVVYTLYSIHAVIMRKFDVY